jgi:RNA polymerase sigma-70 factor (ECF subfamily)
VTGGAGAATKLAEFARIAASRSCHACFGDLELQITEQTDEQLAADAAREGSDGPAFVALVERFRQRVWRICFRLLGNEQDANDAAQEVFVRLFLNRTRFAGRSKYATWVHAIAVRTCLTIRRGRGRRQRHEDTASSEQWEREQPTERHTQSGLSLDLMHMLEILDEEDRAMLILKYAEGHDYEELAAIFDLSVSACKMRLSRAREKLQQRFPDQTS